MPRLVLALALPTMTAALLTARGIRHAPIAVAGSMHITPMAPAARLERGLRHSAQPFDLNPSPEPGRDASPRSREHWTGLMEGGLALDASRGALHAQATLTVGLLPLGIVQLDVLRTSRAHGGTARLAATVRNGAGELLAGRTVALQHRVRVAPVALALAAATTS